MTMRYPHQSLIETTTSLFTAGGLDTPIARVVAEILVEADLLGYSTHGLQFVPAYMAALEAGKWTTSGKPEIVADTGAALRLDAHGLPGQWATVKALELALQRRKEHPVVTVAMGRSHNISCLATYCRRAAVQGVMAIVTTSAPGNAVVAPAGGKAPRLSTSPIAAAIPTTAHPILFDTATSATTNRMIERTRREGGQLPYAALVDADGNPTTDPEAVYSQPPGAILPMGGTETGHKGFAISILIEALTSGLAGWGRAEAGAFGNNVFLQLIDPAAFSGVDAFTAETGDLADRCRDAAAMDPDAPVRMPGDRAHAMWLDQMANGVELHAEILPRMMPLLEKYGIDAPYSAN
ncbi:MAG: Ldh family oxidoreductase [Rhodospirillaceae bacterium]|nr:Ldh family oxidoreductase [Rhodospirillaceae bacterium]